MNWINGIWLLAGVAIGSGMRSWVRRRVDARPVADSPRLQMEAPLAADAAALQKQLQRLQLAYQMATEMSQFKAGFLARVSHEIRSPLNGMIGMQQLILADLCDSPAEEREFIAQANIAALKMVKILDDIIEVSKAESGASSLEIQPIQLAGLLQEVHTQIYLLAQNRNLRLKVVPPDSDLYVLCDPRYLRQVLVNLISSLITELPEGNIQLSVAPTIVQDTVHIWIDDERSPDLWQEAIDLLQTPLPNNQEIPTPGLNLLINQTLIELMHGRLELLATSPAGNRTQCSIPAVIPED